MPYYIVIYEVKYPEIKYLTCDIIHINVEWFILLKIVQSVVKA